MFSELIWPVCTRPFFPFCPLCWPPLFLPFSGHLFALSSPSKVLCSVEQRAQHRSWRGAVSGWTSPQSSGRKFLPELCVKKVGNLATMFLCGWSVCVGQKVGYHQHQNFCNTKKNPARNSFRKNCKNIFQRWSRIWPLLFGFCAISTRLPEEPMGVTKKKSVPQRIPVKITKKIKKKNREGN